MNRDEGTDDVLSQVRKALDDLEIGSPATREALVDGVRDALGSVSEVLRDRRPAKPDLRVVEEPEGAEGAAEPTVNVRWVSAPPAADRGLEDDWLGTIHVPGGESDLPGAWQTVSHAPDPRPYRLRCLAGVIEVVADGAPVARLLRGQTVDIEAQSIRVRGVDGPAHGTYDRL